MDVSRTDESHSVANLGFAVRQYHATLILLVVGFLEVFWQVPLAK
jgi:hypothetical protein